MDGAYSTPWTPAGFQGVLHGKEGDGMEWGMRRKKKEEMEGEDFGRLDPHKVSDGSIRMTKIDLNRNQTLVILQRIHNLCHLAMDAKYELTAILPAAEDQLSSADIQWCHYWLQSASKLHDTPPDVECMPQRWRQLFNCGTQCTNTWHVVLIQYCQILHSTTLQLPWLLFLLPT